MARLVKTNEYAYDGIYDKYTMRCSIDKVISSIRVHSSDGNQVAVALKLKAGVANDYL